MLPCRPTTAAWAPAAARAVVSRAKTDGGDGGGAGAAAGGAAAAAAVGAVAASVCGAAPSGGE